MDICDRYITVCAIDRSNRNVETMERTNLDFEILDDERYDRVINDGHG